MLGDLVTSPNIASKLGAERPELRALILCHVGSAPNASLTHSELQNVKGDRMSALCL